ncbi:MAG: Maf family protein [Thermoguttaceae bacterium]
MQIHLPLILASQSPRRQQLLAAAGYFFEVMPAEDGIEETWNGTEKPENFVQRQAFLKAENVAKNVEKGTILACDTVVLCENQIIGKPSNREEAEQMLRFLRGKVESVLSGLCLFLRPDNTFTLVVESTELYFSNISDTEMNDYLNTDLWMGKAGAFGYQDRLGWIQIRRGSESNIVGLPLERLAMLIRE